MDTNNEEEEVQEENVKLPSVEISDGGGVSIFISSFCMVQFIFLIQKYCSHYHVIDFFRYEKYTQIF